MSMPYFIYNIFVGQIPLCGVCIDGTFMQCLVTLFITLVGRSHNRGNMTFLRLLASSAFGLNPRRDYTQKVFRTDCGYTFSE